MQLLEGSGEEWALGCSGEDGFPEDEFSVPCPSSTDELCPDPPDPGYEITTPSFLVIPFTRGVSTGVENGTALTPTSLPKGPGHSADDAEAYGKGSVGKSCPERNHSG